MVNKGDLSFIHVDLLTNTFVRNPRKPNTECMGTENQKTNGGGGIFLQNFVGKCIKNDEQVDLIGKNYESVIIGLSKRHILGRIN